MSALSSALSTSRFVTNTCRDHGKRVVLSPLCVVRLVQLLFKVMAEAKDAGMRATISIALGDLAFRFPNVLEPWTAQLYGGLRDADPRVRKNTLMVLTHLVLNDMVKVKGQLSEIAVCLEDPDPRVKDLTKMFFTELSKRGTVISSVSALL